MAWFKVDDHFHQHTKVKSIPRQHRASTVGLWLMAGTWVAGGTQDGVVPDYMIRELGATASDAKRLETAGLWERNETDSAWFFHDWFDYQFTKEQILAKNQSNADKQKRYRQRKQANVTPSVTGNADDVTDERYAPPYPTPPVPVLPTEEQPSPTVRVRAKSNKTKLPATWEPTAIMEAELRTRCPGILKATCDLSTRTFRDHFLNGKGSRETRADWAERWLTWVEADWQRTPTPRTATTNGHGPPRSTTDEKVNATLALAQRYAQADQQLALGR